MTALPSYTDAEAWRSPGAQECMQETREEAFYVQRCASLVNPGQTYHIYSYYHSYVGQDGWWKHDNYKAVNMFVKDGIVFEIPMEELFNFYNIDIK